MAWRFATRRETAAGRRFLLVTGLSALARLFTEAFHADSVITLGGFRLAQVWALAVLAAVFYLRQR